MLDTPPTPNHPAQPQQPPAPKKRARLHPISAALILAAFVVTFWKVGVFSGHASATDVIVAFVTPLLAALVGLALGLAMFFIFKRSGSAFNLMFSGVLCVALYIVCTSQRNRAPAPPSQQSLAALTEVQRLTAEMNEQTRKRAQSGGAKLDEQAINDFADKVSDAASKATGPDAILLKCSAQLARDIGAAGVKVATATSSFTEAGGIDARNIKVRNDLDSRLALLDAIKIANDQYERMIVTAPQSLEQSLRRNGMPESGMAQSTAGFRRGGKLEKHITMCVIRRKLVSAEAAYLGVLSDNWGHFSNMDGKLVFEAPPATQALNDALAKVREFRAAQSDWVKENAIAPAPSADATPTPSPNPSPQNR